MDITVTRALKLLREIKSVTFATVNQGRPDARIIDVAHVDDSGLYFITARGKPFCDQLIEHGNVAICGMNKNYTTVRIIGDIRKCEGREIVDKLFDLNDFPYPGDTRDIIDAFLLYRGKGEIFDLSVKPPERTRFSFGGETSNPIGYRITSACTGCGECKDCCPFGVISEGDINTIDMEHCIECGRCREICPEDAIERALGL